MRSPRRESRLRAVARALAAAIAVASMTRIAAQPSPPPPPTAIATSTANASAPTAVSVAAVRAATSAVIASGDLGGTRKEQSWKFRRDDDRAAEPDRAPWLVDLARFIAESGRFLVWLIGAIGVALVIVAARRWMKVRGDPAAKLTAALPSQVHDLDIRPESLPADIGSAVRTLWLDGERRAALSLLYRGALSRLVHSHGIEIADSSTEGDCIRLALAGLAPEPGDFVTRLISAWQLAVYGGRALETTAVLALCEHFDRFLPERRAVAP